MGDVRPAERLPGRRRGRPAPQEPVALPVIGQTGPDLGEEEVAAVYQEAGEPVAGLVVREAGAVPVAQLGVAILNGALDDAGQRALAARKSSPMALTKSPMNGSLPGRSGSARM